MREAGRVGSRWLTGGVLLIAGAALASSGGEGGGGGHHSDPAAVVAAAWALMLLAGKAGAEVALRLKQSSVLGELLAGVVLGNLGLAGFHGLDFLKTDASVDMLARLGVIVLLFEVGLESTVGQMLRVGLSALLVACIGVGLPMVLGWLTAAWLLPDASAYAHAFLGATLTATSVGITARVLQDMKQSQSPTARVLLGAAVIDDVLGLVILAVVAGAINAANAGTSLGVGEVALVLGKSVGFLVGSVVLGLWASPRLFGLACSLHSRNVLLPLALSFAFGLAFLADAIGLAPIVGAFAAGLILEDVHYRGLREREEHSLEELLHPVTTVLVPLFFVVMGMRTDLTQLGNTAVLGLALALIVVGVVGKLASGLGARGEGVNRLAVGVGMIPRGEVGLIFATMGTTLSFGGQAVVTPAVYSAVVVMVIVTTLVTPVALARVLRT